MSSFATTFTTRIAGPSDLVRLEAMNRAAYPELVEDGVVFDAAQLAAHQAVFGEGQLVLEEAGAGGRKIVGALATLIVPGAKALAPHTWIDITSHGTFAAHDPSGDTLYLADVYSDPTAGTRAGSHGCTSSHAPPKRRGVGGALYEALFALCRRKRLARIVAGGRLYGYHDVEHTMSPAAYVDEVVAGTRRDRVLSSQLRAGFVVRDILASYLDDWRSGGYATHLVWQNPDVASAHGASAANGANAASAATSPYSDPRRS
jgi:hypothetical protein